MGREVGYPELDARQPDDGDKEPAPRARRRIGLATCAGVPAGDEDEPLLIDALALRGVETATVAWDECAVDWAGFDLVVVRSAWDYAERREEFLEWARSLPRLLNPLPVLEWNTDKRRYLTALAAAGVPVVPTAFVEPGGELEPPAAPFVVKPSVSAGGRSSARFARGDAAAAELVRRINDEGRTAMVQPFLEEPETALVYLGGRYSHALRRRVPLPHGGARDGLYLDEELEPAKATPRQRAVAERALAAAPGRLLYARVDLMGDVVLELELTEPSLYLAFGEGAADRFAEAIVAAVGRESLGGLR